MKNITENNGEEAFKAKEFAAIKKMENNDFRQAQQIILEAQKLCPELEENMSKILMVCNIHCAAESIVGGDKNLYGILQVEETADQTMITKQFRKIALLVHPDKNKFPSAQEAFKLVTHAYSTLSDPAKRTQYDKKRNNGSQNVPKNDKKKQSNGTDADKWDVPGSMSTFWTMCKNCKYRYEYFIKIQNRKLKCLKCNKVFIAKPMSPSPPYSPSRSVSSGSQDTANTSSSSRSASSGSQDTADTSSSSRSVSSGSQDTANTPSLSRSVSSGSQDTANTPSPSRSVSSGSQDTANMFREQQHDNPSQRGQPVKSSSAFKEEHRSPSGEEYKESEMVKGKNRISETDKNIVGRSSMADPADANIDQNKMGIKEASTMLGSESYNLGTSESDMRKQQVSSMAADPADSNVIDQNKMGIKQASTLPGSESYNLGTSESDRRKQHVSSMADPADSNVIDQNKMGRRQAFTMPESEFYNLGTPEYERREQHVDDGKLSQNNSDGQKREMENEYSCDISMNYNQILEGDITSADRKSSVSSKINVQDKTIGMCVSDEDNIVKEANDSVVLKKSSCCSDPGIKIRDINTITYHDGGVDHIWALYDNIDHMPRSYAKIKFDGHSKCLYWLKFYPLSKEEKEWNNNSLPVACGKYCLGGKVNLSEYSSLYSHTVEWKKIYVKKASGRRSSEKTKMMVCEIYPKSGEVWALFKVWSKQWTSYGDNSKKRSYEYEVVEVLSDMSDNGGANVIPLIRIKGFDSLLVAAMDKSSFYIPSSEVFRFSHRIAHYRVSGHENGLKKINGPALEKNHIIPEGFLLLDSSCLPSDLDATFRSMDLHTYMSKSKNRSRKVCQYEIFPRVGEIWAIYMDWGPERSPSSTDCCEFAVGEIIERSNTSTKFSFLAKVDGSTAVFKRDKQKGVLEIPTGEKLRFSHHIPATFRVTKRKGDKLGAFFDLDPDYLVNAQDHTSSPSNVSIHNPAKKQKQAAAHVEYRRTARHTRPNSRYAGGEWQ